MYLHDKNLDLFIFVLFFKKKNKKKRIHEWKASCFDHYLVICLSYWKAEHLKKKQILKDQTKKKWKQTLQHQARWLASLKRQCDGEIKIFLKLWWRDFVFENNLVSNLVTLLNCFGETWFMYQVVLILTDVFWVLLIFKLNFIMTYCIC